MFDIFDIFESSDEFKRLKDQIKKDIYEKKDSYKESMKNIQQINLEDLVNNIKSYNTSYKVKSNEDNVTYYIDTPGFLLNTCEVFLEQNKSIIAIKYERSDYDESTNQFKSIAKIIRILFNSTKYDFNQMTNNYNNGILTLQFKSNNIPHTKTHKF